MKTFIAAASLAAIAACAGQSPIAAYAEPAPQTVPPTVPLPAPLKAKDSVRTEYAPPAPSASCEILATRTPQGLRLEAVAKSDQPVNAAYDFEISSKASGGSSDVAQGGDADLAPGRSATLGVAEIPRGRYRAVLTLNGPDGELCRTERRS